MLQGTDQLNEIKQSLEGVAGGLSTAFETTLEALVAALLTAVRCHCIRASASARAGRKGAGKIPDLKEPSEKNP